MCMCLCLYTLVYIYIVCVNGHIYVDQHKHVHMLYVLSFVNQSKGPYSVSSSWSPCDHCWNPGSHRPWSYPPLLIDVTYTWPYIQTSINHAATLMYINTKLHTPIYVHMQLHSTQQTRQKLKQQKPPQHNDCSRIYMHMYKAYDHLSRDKQYAQLHIF
jgi:hypothetical protein